MLQSTRLLNMTIGHRLLHSCILLRWTRQENYKAMGTIIDSHFLAFTALVTVIIHSQFSSLFLNSLTYFALLIFCFISRLPISFCFSSSLRSSNSTKSLILLVSLSFTSLLNTIFYSLLLTNQNKFVFEGSTNFIIIAALTLVIKGSWYFRQVT